MCRLFASLADTEGLQLTSCQLNVKNQGYTLSFSNSLSAFLTRVSDSLGQGCPLRWVSSAVKSCIINVSENVRLGYNGLYDILAALLLCTTRLERLILDFTGIPDGDYLGSFPARLMDTLQGVKVLVFTTDVTKVRWLPPGGGPLV